MFFIKDPIKFPDFIHTQKRDPQTNLKSAQMIVDFWSQGAGDLHQVTMLFATAALPTATDTWTASAATRSVSSNAAGCRVWGQVAPETGKASRT